LAGSVPISVIGMPRAGLLLVVGAIAVGLVGQSGASAAGPVAVAAKKCKKHKQGSKKKHKKCKKKKKGSQQPAPTSPATGTGPLVISPASWDFGAFPIGLAYGSQEFTVTNTSTDATGPLSTSIGGANPGAFAKPGDGCAGKSLSGGSSCSLYVGCVGSGSSPATFNADLLVSGNPGGSRQAHLSCRQF
jgi:hypothetical protein